MFSLICMLVCISLATTSTTATDTNLIDRDFYSIQPPISELTSVLQDAAMVDWLWPCASSMHVVHSVTGRVVDIELWSAHDYSVSSRCRDAVAQITPVICTSDLCINVHRIVRILSGLHSRERMVDVPWLTFRLVTGIVTIHPDYDPAMLYDIITRIYDDGCGPMKPVDVDFIIHGIDTAKHVDGLRPSLFEFKMCNPGEHFRVFWSIARMTRMTQGAAGDDNLAAVIEDITNKVYSIDKHVVRACFSVGGEWPPRQARMYLQTVYVITKHHRGLIPPDICGFLQRRVAVRTMSTSYIGRYWDDLTTKGGFPVSTILRALARTASGLIADGGETTRQILPNDNGDVISYTSGGYTGDGTLSAFDPVTDKENYFRTLAANIVGDDSVNLRTTIITPELEAMSASKDVVHGLSVFDMSWWNPATLTTHTRYASTVDGFVSTGEDCTQTEELTIAVWYKRGLGISILSTLANVIQYSSNRDGSVDIGRLWDVCKGFMGYAVAVLGGLDGGYTPENKPDESQSGSQG